MARPYIHFLIAIPLYPTAQSKLPAALSRKAPIARNNLVLNVDIGLNEDEDQSTRVIPLDLGLHCFEKVFWQVGGALRLSNEYMRSFASWPFFSGTKKVNGRVRAETENDAGCTIDFRNVSHCSVKAAGGN